MDNLQAAPNAPTALNVTVQAARRREVRRSSRPREYLTEREIDKLMDAASGNRWGHRDATAILLAYRHGLRASELVALRCRSKGGQPSVHPIGGREPPRLSPLAAGGGQPGRYLFTSERLAPLSVAGYQRMVARAGEAGFPAMCCATRAATSWPTMGGTPDRSNTILATGRLLRRFATRRSRRIGLRISGEIEKSAPPDASDQIKDPHPPPRIKGAHLRDSSDKQASAPLQRSQYSSAQVCGQRPPGAPPEYLGTHRHCHGGDDGWVLGVAVGVVRVGRLTVRRDFSSFDFAFRRSRDPSLRQCRRQKLFGSPSSPPLPASASRAQVSGFFVFFPQT